MPNIFAELPGAQHAWVGWGGGANAKMCIFCADDYGLCEKPTAASLRQQIFVHTELEFLNNLWGLGTK